MSESIRITAPDQLGDLASRLAQDAREDPVVTLVLLEPLGTEAMLAACRDPSSMVIHDQNGHVCGPSNIETLNIESLSTAWRKAVRDMAPMTDITFDLTLPALPQERDGDKTARVHWEADAPLNGGITVATNAVTRLAVTLATATRARVKGRVTFRPAFDSTQRPYKPAMERLGKHLQALAAYEAAK